MVGVVGAAPSSSPPSPGLPAAVVAGQEVVVVVLVATRDADSCGDDRIPAYLPPEAPPTPEGRALFLLGSVGQLVAGWAESPANIRMPCSCGRTFQTFPSFASSAAAAMPSLERIAACHPAPEADRTTSRPVTTDASFRSVPVAAPRWCDWDSEPQPPPSSCGVNARRESSSATR